MSQREEKAGNGAQDGGVADKGSAWLSPKGIVKTLLFLFVGISIVHLILTEIRPKPSPAAPTEKGPTPPVLAPPPPELPPSGEPKTIVYYFHGNVRCITCRAIESLAKEAIERGFAGPLEAGRLEWREVNVDEPGQEHFVKDFQLATRSVVLERVQGGKRQDWKNLSRIWELIRGEKDGFVKYIQDETKAFLGATAP